MAGRPLTGTISASDFTTLVDVPPQMRPRLDFAQVRYDEGSPAVTNAASFGISAAAARQQ
jgi:hypothetical protein